MTGTAAAEAVLHDGTVLLAEQAERSVLESLAAGRGWRRAAISTAGFGEMEQVAWQAGVAFVLYSEVHVLGHRVVRVSGDDAAVVEETLGVVRATLPTVAPDALLDVLLAVPHADARESIRALNGLRAADMWNCADGTEPPADPRYRTAVERAVLHPERQVVRALVFAVGDLMTVRPGLAEPILALRGADGPARDVIDDFAAFCDRR
ncbi:hypothetical protein [Actinomadura chibensis]|uniref:Uncharacterized protein n=1 Tax=Actinomadura chibensis TaxID=392828 RepID=A0A5D0NLV2_9ACTN|nr:hypothetical protein [Actinomadura chibensis]TYB45248.1 hypothetical protein FXF69_17460 [Actinomadura chibensis]